MTGFIPNEDLKQDTIYQSIINNVIKIINTIAVDHKPVNYWDGIHYKPYVKKMIDKDELIKKLNEK